MQIDYSDQMHRLHSLFQFCRSHAELSLKTKGYVSPAYLADTSNGVLVYHPPSVSNPSEREYFMSVGSDLGIAHGAKAVAMILKMYSDDAIPKRMLAEEFNLVADSDHLVISVAVPFLGRTYVLPLERDNQDRFQGFGSGRVYCEIDPLLASGVAAHFLPQQLKASSRLTEEGISFQILHYPSEPGSNATPVRQLAAF